MTKTHPNPRRTLASYIDDLQGKGRYAFSRRDALPALGVSPEALEAAARRLAAKRRVLAPKRGFFVIVPVEYRSAGGPPTDWFIDDLMKHLKRPYYVGLLSAAALHGAAHQQPQQFQVVTDAPLRPARAGRAHILFITKRRFGGTPTSRVKTATGSMAVSTPEATALDLVRYAPRAGHLQNVATVLAELAEKLNPELLVEAAKADVELTHVQRLGYLLDLVGASRCAKSLAAWIAGKRARPTRLRPDRRIGNASKNDRWRVMINDRIEVDL